MKTNSAPGQRRALLIALVSLPLCAGAAPLEVGAPWPMLSLADQHEQPVAIVDTTELVIFCAEKSVSDMVNSVLGSQGKVTLARANAVYVADISAMPAMIARMFAVPQLRDLPFPIALVRDASSVADLPRRKGSATLLTLKNRRVTQIQHLETPTQLRLALALAP